MKYLVIFTPLTGETFWLRGTTWAFRVERAFDFDSKEEAELAINKAMFFMEKTSRKFINIVEAQNGQP